MSGPPLSAAGLTSLCVKGTEMLPRLLAGRDAQAARRYFLAKSKLQRYNEMDIV